jgi:Rrf2 family protein
MRMTLEADYAIRILYCLGCNHEKVDAKAIAEATGVTIRFTLKILHKLLGAGLVISFKGANGGYKLAKSPAEISIGQIIEVIDGPIAINHCLRHEFSCTRTTKTECNFHKMFRTVNNQLREELYQVTLDQFVVQEGKEEPETAQ